MLYTRGRPTVRAAPKVAAVCFGLCAPLSTESPQTAYDTQTACVSQSSSASQRNAPMSAQATEGA